MEKDKEIQAVRNYLANAAKLIKLSREQNLSDLELTIILLLGEKGFTSNIDSQTLTSAKQNEVYSLTKDLKGIFPPVLEYELKDRFNISSPSGVSSLSKKGHLLKLTPYNSLRMKSKEDQRLREYLLSQSGTGIYNNAASFISTQ